MRPLVTGNTLRDIRSTRESATTEAEAQVPPEQREDFDAFQTQLGVAFRKLEAAPAAPVLWAPDDRSTSLLQSYLSERAEARPGPAEEARFDDADLKGWVGSFFQWWRRVKPHDFLEQKDAVPRELPDKAQIAMFADWGVGDLYGAGVLDKTIASRQVFPDPIHAVIHLGDTYYSGTEQEVQERLVKVWPQRPEASNFALNGNHEMYGGGKGYYAAIADERFGQSVSYFALQNAHFTIVGLDTAYPDRYFRDHRLYGNQLAWLQEIVAKAGERKIVLLSHHQPFSVFEPDGDALVAQLTGLLDRRRIFAWYWGHEHRLTIYNPHPRWGTQGRCIGHGGYPYYRVNPQIVVTREPGMPTETVAMDLDDKGQGGSTWYHFPENINSPAGAILADNNPHMGAEADKYGAQGFVTLDLDGPRLTERFHRPDGTVIRQGLLAQ